MSSRERRTIRLMPVVNRLLYGSQRALSLVLA